MKTNLYTWRSLGKFILYILTLGVIMQFAKPSKKTLVITQTETTIDSIYLDQSGNVIDHVITLK